MEDWKELGEFGIDTSILSRYQILCLPENIQNQPDPSELIDAGDSITLSKLLKEEGLECANSYDLGLDAKVSDRRGLELWLGSIWVLNHAALPLLISVVGRLLGEKIQKKLATSKQIKASQDDENLETMKVHANLKVVNEKINVDIEYHGDTDTFIKVLKSINDDSE